MKKGFGIIEVLAAAVVLGFLVIALTRLQLGNRESILRVRARDAANLVAQHVLDSLGSVGANSITVLDGDGGENTVFADTNYKYSFVSKRDEDSITSEIKYKVAVVLIEPDDEDKHRSEVEEASEFTKATGGDEVKTIESINKYAKNLEATVSWEFKGTTQSITMAKVVR